MKKSERKISKAGAFILKTVLWLITAALLCAGIFYGNREKLSMILMLGAAVMGLISVFAAFRLDTIASRQEDDE